MSRGYVLNHSALLAPGFPSKVSPLTLEVTSTSLQLPDSKSPFIFFLFPGLSLLPLRLSHSKKFPSIWKCIFKNQVIIILLAVHVAIPCIYSPVQYLLSKPLDSFQVWSVFYQPSVMLFPKGSNLPDFTEILNTA